MKTFEEILEICKEINKGPNSNFKFTRWLFTTVFVFNNKNYYISFYPFRKNKNKLHYSKGTTTYTGGGEDYSDIEEGCELEITQLQKEILIALFNYK